MFKVDRFIHIGCAITNPNGWLRKGALSSPPIGRVRIRPSRVPRVSMSFISSHRQQPTAGAWLGRRPRSPESAHDWHDHSRHEDGGFGAATRLNESIRTARCITTESEEGA